MDPHQPIHSKMYGSNIKWFDKQSPALDHCVVADGEDNGVFVLQKFCGRRRFAVCSYEAFCERYLQIAEEACHFYEVIRSNEPCRLHFDIDVDLASNLTAVGSVLVDQLISYVNHCLQVKYHRISNRHQILILDSSTTKKFSQHVIYPTVVFRSNLDCGNFVKSIVHAAWKAVEDGEDSFWTNGFPEDTSFWLFTDNADQTATFVSDITIYSKNRHFRIWRSSKLEKNVPLRVAQENIYPLFSEEQTFRDSMVVPPPRAWSDPPYLEFSEKSSIDTVEGSASTESSSRIVRHSSNPSLDKFVLKHIRMHPKHKEADIAAITEFENGCSVNYSIRGTKWCPFVEREHSSNHPYYCVQFRRGIISIRCHSHQCRSKETRGSKIPKHLCQARQ